MENILFIVIIALLIVIAALVIVLIVRRPKRDGDTASALNRIERRQEAAEAALSSQLARIEDRRDATDAALRGEILTQFTALGDMNGAALSRMSENTRKELSETRQTVERRMLLIQEENRRNLADMRQTVDKQLSETLSAGLSNSFKAVSQNLEQMLVTMGEMRSMTGDITDLKKILANVKNRGTWGEVQLGALIEDILTPSQYKAQLMLEGGSERVDFAVVLPGAGEHPVMLPIDSKFPMDKYQAVLLAEDSCDAAAVSLTREALRKAVTEQAKSVRQKYIRPPQTTDFALLFVPSEGLYAYLSSLGVCAALQTNERVLIAGPSTLAALLNSLQLGFKTLAIEQRTTEITRLLSAVKTAFLRFEGNLESIGKSLHSAERHLDTLKSNSRTITRSLKSVEKAEEADARELLGEGTD